MDAHSRKARAATQVADLRSLLSCAHLHAHTRLTLLRNWRGSQSKPKSEAARVAAIRELLDRGYGKTAQMLAAENEDDLSNKTAEELRTEVLADIANLFPDLRFVPAKPRNSLVD